MKKQLNNFYKIQKGDTIDSIASLYGVNPIKILILNNTSPFLIKDGDYLFIPFLKK